MIGRGWVQATALKPQDRLQGRDGSAPEVTGITTEARAVPVYNFEVEDDHNYYVTSAHVLVHNNCTSDLGAD
ncbi:hypothetical protein JOF41_001244 [Saccharothrix coeruleofusca]|uniref:polymorphic toxin-type HINT domain-containing protein n=1 Tax=Saccharothrix coeruleofusca TaxID=33919 RepID=UPI001AE157C9|nr:polymorphic toxin-type HINT domain-containing protein [Saccharothrix coeruleofusca]MBP2335066.1 hypothetical protein [Saccharothrix coeruleofusca]